jgi:hypothetical protein
MVVSIGGVETFAPAPDGEDFDIRQYAARMNDATSFHSSIYGETWSQTLQKVSLVYVVLSLLFSLFFVVKTDLNILTVFFSNGYLYRLLQTRMS